MMGIDYGAKRVGIALSDEAGRVAFPKATLPNDKTLVSELVALIEAHTIAEIVIGDSIGNTGMPNPIAHGARTLVETLKMQSSAVIHFEPEFYSSQEARLLSGKHSVDAEAATIILNSFLTKRHGTYD